MFPTGCIFIKYSSCLKQSQRKTLQFNIKIIFPSFNSGIWSVSHYLEELSHNSTYAKPKLFRGDQKCCPLNTLPTVRADCGVYRTMMSELPDWFGSCIVLGG